MNHSHLSTRIQGLDTSPIRKAFELAASLKNPINLSIGQPHFPCPANIVEALNRAASIGKTAYTITGGISELKEAMIEKYKSVNQIQYATPSRILITSGISSALLLLFNTLVNPDDDCLIIEPYFLMYPSMLKFNGANVHTLPEKFTKEDLDKYKNKKFKLIIFSNPSNPTGYVFNKEQLLMLIEFSKEANAYLISDEIYEMFDYDKEFISTGSLYDQAIVLSGFSKSYSMTGLRLASVMGPEDIIFALTVLQQYTIVCAPSTTQYAGIEALKTDMSKYIEDYREKRDYVYENLKDYYSIDKSKGAFYYFLKIRGNDEQFVERAVKEKGLIVVPGFIFTNSHNYIRISFASEWENLKRGVQALKELA